MCKQFIGKRLAPGRFPVISLRLKTDGPCDDMARLVVNTSNNLKQIIDTKSLSFRQLRQAQKFSRYYFQLDYRQGKPNIAANILSRYFQKSPAKEEDLKAENTQICHCPQSLLTNASLLSLTFFGLTSSNTSSLSSTLSLLYQVFICGTQVLPQLFQFWDTFRSELANEGPYKASIGLIRLKRQELQQENKLTTLFPQVINYNSTCLWLLYGIFIALSFSSLCINPLTMLPSIVFFLKMLFFSLYIFQTT